MITVELPWPNRILSPNTRGCWQTKLRAKSGAKEAGYWLGLQHHGQLQGVDVHAWLTFYPPDRRKRDLDNLLASLKPDIDGLCEGIGIDDSQIKRVTVEWGDLLPKEGKVILHIAELPPDDVARMFGIG